MLARKSETISVVVTDIVIVKGVDERMLLVESPLLLGLEDLMIGKDEFIRGSSICRCIVQITDIHEEVWSQLTHSFKAIRLAHECGTGRGNESEVGRRSFKGLKPASPQIRDSFPFLALLNCRLISKDVLRIISGQMFMSQIHRDS
jgi:hypothetical protein